MDTPTIDALPTVPNRSMTDTDFVPAMDGFLAAFPGFRLQANALAAGVDAQAALVAGDTVQSAANANVAQSARDSAVAAAAAAAQIPETPATSGSNVTIANTGNVTFNLNESGKAFGIGQSVKCTTTADITRYIIGVISGFSGTTMQVTCMASGGSGSSTSWSIALIPPLANSFNGGTHITGANVQNTVADAALAIDLSGAGADFHTKAIATNSTFTFSGFDTGGNSAQGFLLEITLSAGAVPSWPASVGWGDNVDPSSTLGNGRHQLTFVTVNGGANWTGAVRAKNLP